MQTIKCLFDVNSSTVLRVTVCIFLWPVQKSLRKTSKVLSVFAKILCVTPRWKYLISCLLACSASNCFVNASSSCMSRGRTRLLHLALASFRNVSPMLCLVTLQQFAKRTCDKPLCKDRCLCRSKSIELNISLITSTGRSVSNMFGAEQSQSFETGVSTYRDLREIFWVRGDAGSLSQLQTPRQNGRVF